MQFVFLTRVLMILASLFAFALAIVIMVRAGTNKLDDVVPPASVLSCAGLVVASSVAMLYAWSEYSVRRDKAKLL
jgi:hypothetical protein